MKHYLIIRTSSLGDVALSLQLVYAIARKYPEDRFTYLMKPTITGVLINPPSNLEAMTVDIKGSDRSLFALFRLANTLFHEHFDAVIDLQRSWRTRFLTRYLHIFSKAESYTVHKLPPPEAAVAAQKDTDRIPYSLGNQVLTLFEQVFRRAKLEAEVPYPLLKSAESDGIELSETVPLPQVPELIGFAPFAKHESPSKASIADAKSFLDKILEAFPQIGVLIIGAEETLSTAFEGSQRCTLLPPNTSFHRELNALSKLSLLVGIDSSFLHLAEMVGTKVLFLPETPSEEMSTTVDNIIKQIDNIIPIRR